METFTKRVSAETLKMIQHVGDIFPTFTTNGEFIFATKLDYTVDSWEEIHGMPVPDYIRFKIISLIDKLHEAGVLHGDLHRQNVVFNIDATVKIIDFDCDPDKNGFEKSRFISDLTDEDVQNYVDFWDSASWQDEPISTVKGLIAYERHMWEN